jgi:hypothetical protein
LDGAEDNPLSISLEREIINVFFTVGKQRKEVDLLNEAALHSKKLLN